MIVTKNETQRTSARLAPADDPAERARRVTELKRKVESGTYLIRRYEIIEGLLQNMAESLD